MAGYLFGSRTVGIYPTPDDLAAKVDEYFEQCFITKFNPKLGMDVKVEVETPTFSGIARYLGFRNRNEFLNYKNQESELYEAIIDDAKLRIEAYMEGKLVHSKNPSGLIFALKNNAGWEDVSKKQISGDDKKPMLFAWEGTSSDVIDVTAEKVEKEGVLPPPTPKNGGSIDTA